MTLSGPQSQQIIAIAYDSRRVENHSIFFCMVGEHADGHRFIEDAIQKGACAVVGSDASALKEASDRHPTISFIFASETRRALACFSAHYYNRADQKLKTAAVTGTNGKTTVTSYIRSLLNHLGMPTGQIGTAGIWDDQSPLPFKQTTPTTPEAPDLQAIFQHLQHSHVKAVAMEATSIAIEQNRLAEMIFDVGIYTNLSPEHLEFHPTMDHYREAKLKLFNQVRQAVVNIDDDELSQTILTRFNGPVLTYGMDRPADISAKAIQADDQGTRFILTVSQESHPVRAPIFGRYNMANLLAAIGTCLLFGHSLHDIISVLPKVEGPEGRFQKVETYPSHQIVLDYAHTPEALINVLEAARQLTYKRLILLITGIGLRDPQKRPKMAKAAEGHADEIVVSVDHPGYFDRDVIADDVRRGFTNPFSQHIHKTIYREDGIHHALSLAEEGDLVLITGLGFGGYQVICGENVPYDELAVIHSYFQKKARERVYVREQTS